MTRIGGPSQSSRLQATLARLQQRAAEKTAATGPADRFADTGADAATARRLGKDQVKQPVARAVAGRGVLDVRLGALTGVDVSRTVTGDVRVERAADLARLQGVTRLEGQLVVGECALGAIDLAALSSLREVAGSLSFEGLVGVRALDTLAALERVGGALYVGWSDALEELRLPALQSVGRGLVVEGLPRLTHLELPRLERVDGYLHLHENAALAAVALPALASVGGELSIVDNPRLTRVELARLARPSDVEVQGATTALAFAA